MEDNIAAGLRIAKRIAKRWSKPWVPMRAADEVESAALVSVAVALKKYDPAKVASFDGYCRAVVERGIIRYFESVDHLSQYHRQQVRDGKCEDPVEAMLSLEGVCEVGDEPGVASWEDAAIDAVDLHRAVGALPPALRDVVLAHYWGDESLASIGARTGVSKRATAKICEAAEAKIRRTLSLGSRRYSQPDPRASA